MERFKHKYIFYFFKKLDRKTWEYKSSFFRFFGRVSDGKVLAQSFDREFDYQKIY